jgi:hypothetical protein
MRFNPWTPSLALAAFLLSGVSYADPSYYLVTVYDNEGEANVDFRYWTVEPKRRHQTVWPEVGFGYGVTSRWYSEVFVSSIGRTFNQVKVDSVNWQNDFLLTQGQYPFDLALHTNLAVNGYRSDGRTWQWGPVLQTEIGRLQLNGNLFFDRTYLADGNVPTETKYQWQAKYRWRSDFQFGLQGFGELGPWDHWLPASGQSHRVGPVFAGTLKAGKGDAIKYSLAYLVGKSYGLQGQMVSLRLQYVF